MSLVAAFGCVCWEELLEATQRYTPVSSGCTDGSTSLATPTPDTSVWFLKGILLSYRMIQDTFINLIFGPLLKE